MSNRYDEIKFLRVKIEAEEKSIGQRSREHARHLELHVENTLLQQESEQ